MNNSDPSKISPALNVKKDDFVCGPNVYTCMNKNYLS